MQRILINLPDKAVSFYDNNFNHIEVGIPEDTSAVENLIAFCEAYKTPEQIREDKLTDLAIQADPDAAKELVKDWKSGEFVNVGSHRKYGDLIYIVIQAHTTQADWTPDITPALWSVYNSAAEDPTTTAPWIAGEAVKVGDLREYKGVIYRAVQAHTTQDGWTPEATPDLWAKEE